MDVIAAIASGVLIILFIIWFNQRHRKEPASSKAGFGMTNESATAPAPKIPARLVIGEDPAQPMLTIQASNADADYAKGTPLDVGSHSISRLSALMQALPSIVLASEVAGKRLMEVVINGDLVRAADGNGMRAFCMGAKGIKEQARLFDEDQLKNMVNVSALWQIASVVVAQKHMADISAKLDDIRDGVSGISQFLDNQRKSRIEAAYDYLGQAYRAIQGGELPASVRLQLEAREVDLTEIQRHLEKEYHQLAAKKVEDQEFVGTEELTKNILRKIASLEALARDISLCTKTRILAWHVLSLYPGEPQLKLARRESIEQSIELFLQLGVVCSSAMADEISNVKSSFNREETLQARRASLSKQTAAAVKSVHAGAQSAKVAIVDSAQRMVALDRPTTMLFEFNGRELVGVRETGVGQS